MSTTKNKVHSGSCFSPEVHETIGLGAWFSNVWAWNRDYHELPDEDMPGSFDSFVDALIQSDHVSWGDADATITYHSSKLNEVFREWVEFEDGWCVSNKPSGIVLPHVCDGRYGINYESHTLYNFGEPRLFDSVEGELAVYNEDEGSYDWHDATYDEDEGWQATQ